MSHRVLAVIVCYNPNIEALKVQLKALREQQVAALLVDNASSNIAALEVLLKDLGENISLRRLAQNMGLGAAHNLGVSVARDHGYTHVLLLDQDSVPLPGMVDKLLQAWVSKQQQLREGRENSAIGLSAVGASYLNADTGSESFFVRFGLIKFQRNYCSQQDTDGCIEADFLISSGSLIALQTLDEIGLMDESLFIDHVDTEWFLRARSMGYRAYGVCGARMQHGLGETTHQIRIGRRRNVPQHKPFRYYYIFRNSVLLYRRGNAAAVWKWNDLQRLLMIAFWFGLVKGPRLGNLRMMGKGVMHGLRGTSGPMPTKPTQ
ncbi:MAG: glycosyltransferase family 2 protein [Gammaproteobacteria bacterium]|nr:glycosyltransferase family 2 protein [Gammaproteobacteria bacterium]